MLYCALEGFADIRQVSSERNSLEVELTENLRRRREELRGKLDDLEGDAGSGILQSGEVELRNNELANLTRTIERLIEQITGELPQASYDRSVQLIGSQNPRPTLRRFPPRSPQSPNSSTRCRMSSSRIPARS